MNKHKVSRRTFIRRAAYVAPVILTLAAQPSFASSGSYRRGHDHHGGGHGRRDHGRGYDHDSGHEGHGHSRHRR